MTVTNMDDITTRSWMPKLASAKLKSMFKCCSRASSIISPASPPEVVIPTFTCTERFSASCSLPERRCRFDTLALCVCVCDDARARRPMYVQAIRTLEHSEEMSALHR